MCGIIGFVGPPDHGVLLAMRDALVHRGPDEAGAFESPLVSMAHRRLAIVDVLHGQQPMSTPTGELVIVYNGEIYNHGDLRRRFLSEVPFRTSSDTETLLLLYEKLGHVCLDHLRGMFAFVIYDARKRLLFGARDPMGEKPLYYTLGTHDQVSFAFASESKAFARHPALRSAFSLDDDGIRDYLLHDYTCGERTIHSGIHRLLPGHWFSLGLPGSEHPGFRTHPYWRLDFTPKDRRPVSVLDELERAVAEQLMSDVPLGVFLSGGIDSSMITRLLANRRSLDQIDAFSIGFEDSSFDESEFAREAASAIGVRWHHRVFQASDLLARIPKIAAHLDEPFADPSLLPVSLLSEFARQHVTVALGGDGGDELFAGYDPFLAVAPARWIRRLGFVGQAFLRAFSDWIPSSDKNMGLRFRFERLLRGVEVPIELQCAAWMGPFSWTSLRRLCPELVSGVEIQRAFPEELAWLHQALDRNRMDDMTLALDFFQRIYLPDDILVKVDRASMMHSLEVRCPFLDRELVTLANQLPIQAKIAGRQTKVLFKQEIKRRNLLPERITNRSKKGFGIPIAAWLKRELKGAFEERVIHGWPRDLPPLVATELHRLWEEHLSGRRNNYKELWALLMLAWWRQSHGENRALASD